MAYDIYIWHNIYIWFVVLFVLLTVQTLIEQVKQTKTSLHRFLRMRNQRLRFAERCPTSISLVQTT